MTMTPEQIDAMAREGITQLNLGIAAFTALEHPDGLHVVIYPYGYMSPVIWPPVVEQPEPEARLHAIAQPIVRAAPVAALPRLHKRKKP
jgi:hypothetical protein